MSTTRIRSAALPLLAVLALTGCDAIFRGANDLPDEARVEVEGPTGVDYELVTSTEFAVFRDLQTGAREIQILSADTAVVSTPHDAVVDMAGPSPRGFLMRLLPLGDSVVTTSVKVVIDGKQEFSRTGSISPESALEYSKLYYSN